MTVEAHVNGCGAPASPLRRRSSGGVERAGQAINFWKSAGILGGGYWPWHGPKRRAAIVRSRSARVVLSDPEAKGDLGLSRPLSDPIVELVAARLRLLGQPVRVRLIDRLDRVGEAHVQQLADELGATQQNASKHLTALWRSGVLARRHEGRVTVYWLADREAWNVAERTAATIAEQLRSHPAPGAASSGASG